MEPFPGPNDGSKPFPVHATHYIQSSTMTTEPTLVGDMQTNEANIKFE